MSGSVWGRGTSSPTNQDDLEYQRYESKDTTPSDSCVGKDVVGAWEGSTPVDRARRVPPP